MKMDDKNIVGKRITGLRKQAGLSQKELAAKIGISAASLSWWENGKSELSHQNLIWYAREFGVTTDYLLGVSDEMRTHKPYAVNAPKESNYVEPDIIAAHVSGESLSPAAEERVQQLIKQAFDKYVLPKIEKKD